MKEEKQEVDNDTSWKRTPRGGWTVVCQSIQSQARGSVRDAL